ncbi:MAG: hypothetical protein RIQ56_839, partial [Candidatus Parcubacteria bacterium]
MFDENKVRMDLLQLQKPIIPITGEVNHEMYRRVSTSILFLVSKGSPPIELWIDSGGGSVAAGLDIYDLVRTYKNQVDGVVHAYAASMAAMILQGCAKRSCMRHGTVLIHHISRDEVKLDTLRIPVRRDQMIKRMEKSQRRLYDILSERTKQPLTKIRATCAKDEPMSAEEALDFGLI